MSRMRVASHSAAAAVSPLCSLLALTLGMRSSSFSSARLRSRFCWRYSVTDIRLRSAWVARARARRDARGVANIADGFLGRTFAWWRAISRYRYIQDAPLPLCWYVEGRAL